MRNIGARESYAGMKTRCVGEDENIKEDILFSAPLVVTGAKNIRGKGLTVRTPR